MASFPVRIEAKDTPLAASRPWVFNLGVRMPWLGRAMLRAGFRLPPGRIRSRFMEYGAREAAMGTMYRRDFGMITTFQAPDLEMVPAVEIAAAVGSENTLHGQEAVIAYIHDWNEAWRSMSFIPKVVYDLGESRVLVLSQVEAMGTSSGVKMNSTEEAELWEWERGRVRRITQWWRSWDDALAAVGLDPERADS
jgi:hypothetical protein